MILALVQQVFVKFSVLMDVILVYLILNINYPLQMKLGIQAKKSFVPNVLYKIMNLPVYLRMVVHAIRILLIVETL